MHASSRNVLITGAGVRIGRAIALYLAKEGWNVAIHCRRSKREANALAAEIKKLGRKAVVVMGDLEDAGAPERIVAQARQKLGPLSCLINNASQFRKDTLSTFTEASLASHFAVNAFAPLRLIRHFAAQCPKKTDNSIVNIGDNMYGWSLSPNFLSYALSKMMLANMTQLLATELAPHIRINVIAPGPTLPGHMDKPDTFRKLERRLPMQRTTSLAELCETVGFVLGARTLTGQCISLSSGLLSPEA